MKTKSNYKKPSEDGEDKPSAWEERPARLQARLTSYLASPSKMDSLIEKIRATSGNASEVQLKEIAVGLVERVFALVLRTNRAEHQTWIMLEACGMNITKLELLEDLLKDRYVSCAPLSEESVSAHLACIKVLGAYNRLVFVDCSHADFGFAVGSVFTLDEKEYRLTHVTDHDNKVLPAIPPRVKTLCRFEPEIPGLAQLTTWDAATTKRKYLDFDSAPEPEAETVSRWDRIKDYAKRLFTH